MRTKVLRERARLKNTLYVDKKQQVVATARLDGSHLMSAALAGNFAKRGNREIVLKDEPI